MLDPKSIQVIQSTVPVLETHGEQITTRFYEMMFTDHPELYNIFNVIHQKKKQQQKALANAVYQAAKHIDRLNEILPVLETVFQKHRSLGVKAEHYPIVGKYLLLAIKDVLGDAATDEILNAWEKAYGVLASVFIEKEQALYDETASQNGGWDGWREFIVKHKIPESNVITSFYLEPADGKALPTYLPGQYISVKFFLEDLQYHQIRQYSLSDAPGKEYYRISVKKEDANEHPAGMISSFLHDSIDEGDTLSVSAPAGDFYLNTEKTTPIVLLSGGVGQTPMMSMFNHLLTDKSERELIYIHAAINGEHHAFQKHVQEQATIHKNIKAYICYEKPNQIDQERQNYDKAGFVDFPWLKQIIPTTDADFYFCGPIPFMKSIKSSLLALDVPVERIHYEFFGPANPMDA